MKQKPRGKPGAKPRRFPSLAYSTRNKTDAAYRDRLAVLKGKYGVSTKLKIGGKLTPQRKAAITRLTRKYSAYLNPKNGFEFVPASKQKLKKVVKNGGTAKNTVTTKGVFVQRPKTDKRVKFEITENGDITSQVGNRTNSIKIFPSVDVVANPKIVLEEAKRRKAQYIFVNIKGSRGHNKYSVKAFEWYLNNILLLDVEEAVEEEDKSNVFRNWFGVEYISFNRKSYTKKRRKK